MNVESQSKDQVVAAAIGEISHIATLPEITLKIVQLVENPNSTAQDLHKLISNDPALCSRVLKVVNSAFYGLPGQIASINRAIVLLGLNAVKNIAIAASLAKLFRGGDITPEFSARRLWDHSIATSTAAKMVADEMNLGLADEAFLAGLMHDIGIIVEIQYDRNTLVEVVNALNLDDAGKPSGDMRSVELEKFGATHEDFGRGLCEQWKFPRSFANVAGSHHDPLALAEEQRTLPAVIAIADHISGVLLENGFRIDLAKDTLNPSLLDVCKLTSDQISAIAAGLPERIESVEQMLS